MELHEAIIVFLIIFSFLSLVANIALTAKIAQPIKWPNYFSSVELTYYCVKSWSKISKTADTSAGLSLGGKEEYFAILEKCDQRGRNLNYGPFICQTPELLTEEAMYCLRRQNNNELAINPFRASF